MVTGEGGKKFNNGDDSPSKPDHHDLGHNLLPLPVLTTQGLSE